jgi:hypothetical protein
VGEWGVGLGQLTQTRARRLSQARWAGWAGGPVGPTGQVGQFVLAICFKNRVLNLNSKLIPFWNSNQIYKFK